MYFHEAHDYESLVQEVMKLDSADESKEHTQSDFINKYLNSRPGTWTLISVSVESVLKELTVSGRGKTHTIFHFFWSVTK